MLLYVLLPVLRLAPLRFQVRVFKVLSLDTSTLVMLDTLWS